jgi:hypothetical protein
VASMHATCVTLGSDAFLNVYSALQDKRLLRRFYSSDRIGSWKAKRFFVPPDLVCLPHSGRADDPW